jgi:hypothetical protein
MGVDATFNSALMMNKWPEPSGWVAPGTDTVVTGQPLAVFGALRRMVFEPAEHRYSVLRPCEHVRNPLSGQGNITAERINLPATDEELGAFCGAELVAFAGFLVHRPCARAKEGAQATVSHEPKKFEYDQLGTLHVWACLTGPATGHVFVSETTSFIDEWYKEDEMKGKWVSMQLQFNDMT